MTQRTAPASPASSACGRKQKRTPAQAKARRLAFEQEKARKKKASREKHQASASSQSQGGWYGKAARADQSNQSVLSPADPRMTRYAQRQCRSQTITSRQIVQTLQRGSVTHLRTGAHSFEKDGTRVIVAPDTKAIVTTYRKRHQKPGKRRGFNADSSDDHPTHTGVS